MRAPLFPFLKNFLFLTPAEDSPIKIIDFGLSRHDDSYQGIMKTKVGTPYYVAPEVLRREYTNSCDIWSIGKFYKIRGVLVVASIASKSEFAHMHQKA